MINLSGLSQFMTTAQTLGDLILITPNKNIGISPQPIQKTSDSGTFSGFSVLTGFEDSFLFNYQGEDIVSMSSDITDHYIEDNTAIQDQISLRPIQIKVSGYICELNDIAPALLEPLKFAAEKLTIISAYTPVLSETAIIAYNNAFFAYQTAVNLENNFVQTWTTFSQNKFLTTKQQEAFNKFYGYWTERRLFTVQTPWAIFKDMAILKMDVVQSAEDRQTSTFEIIFKKMRFSSTLTIAANNTVGKVQETRFSTANSKVVNLPASKPVESTPLGDLL